MHIESMFSYNSKRMLWHQAQFCKCEDIKTKALPFDSWFSTRQNAEITVEKKEKK